MGAVGWEEVFTAIGVFLLVAIEQLVFEVFIES